MPENVNTFKILLIEDNPGDVLLVEEMLAETENTLFSMIHTDRLSTGIKCLNEKKIDVILLDISLPDSHGIKTFTTLQAHVPKIPIVVLSGLDDETIAIEALKDGVQDYLIKGRIDGNMLLRSIRYAIERKQIELALQESERRHRRLLELMPDIVYRIDENGIFVYLNEAVQYLGYKPEELIGKHFSVLIHPDDLGKVSRTNFIQRYFNKPPLSKKPQKFFDERRTGERKTSDLEVRIKTKRAREYKPAMLVWNKVAADERVIEVAATGHYDVDTVRNDKVFLGTIGVIRDATERKQTESMLRILFLAVEHSPCSIIVTNTEGRIEYVNPKFTESTQYQFDEVIGKTPGILKSGLTSPESYKNLWETITLGVEWHGEFCNRKKNGELYWEATSISSIKDDDGRIIHFLSVKEDITERKRTEEKINYLAYYDDITGLPNRALFNYRLNQEISHAHRNKKMLAVMFIDLDRFKVVNDTLGHSVGDELLKVIAERLQSCLRECDIVSRLSGDEFAVLLPEINQTQDIEEIAHRINASIKKTVAVKGHKLHISGSIGIAIYPNERNV